MKPAARKYQTTNWKAYNAALKARGSLLIWLDPTMNWHGQANGKRGRSPTFSDEAIQFCLSIKCLFSLPLRQAMGMTQSLLQLTGLDWPVPDYSTISRRQKKLRVAIEVMPTTTGLHLLVDSTGIKMLGEGEWKTRKHGADYRRQWRKVHLGIDASTLEIRAMEVTDNSIGDAPMLPNLLGQIPPEELLASVSGDGAYDTKGCHEAIARRQADAIIPIRKNAKLWKMNRIGATARNEILRATRRLGRTIWKKWSGYHRRSLVETKMRCFKLLGERIMARDFDRQVAELQVRAAVLNRFTRLGTPITVAMP
ncbi:IS5 family transposase|uniref:IS5 family transposase n=1 Tax=Noviherbaspirillum sp. L7-7A TaxID=2850560 RepID=UPI001C2BEF55|nr:IS5 family transposase [Noviherbaspirillum sp. L7-7A]MBV0879568.1 IS5 family transposase [Noviherbaspirillum sp. L7-7A]MBV0880621.1 IS5 family transposase [Noviherbaspirillum sp. L7-7A]MBV0880655.1 IS5 family transposase [Noviherbaspirillum sp. L7-7A]